jgi:hypothetical protein
LRAGVDSLKPSGFRGALLRQLSLQGFPDVVNVGGFNRPVAARERYLVFQNVLFSQFERVLYPRVAHEITCGKAFHRIAVNATICQFNSAVAHIPHQRDLDGEHGRFALVGGSRLDSHSLQNGAYWRLVALGIVMPRDRTAVLQR